MQKLAVFFVAFVLLLSRFAAAQEPADNYQETFARGIAALTEGRHQEGIDAFSRCLELSPENSTCAYNLACGHSLIGAKDQAFEWLDRSIDWGFAMSADNIELMQKDADLATLRDDARFAAAIERARALRVAIEAYMKEPAIHVPEGAVKGQSLGLLVVLHDLGSNKEALLAGPWARVADTLGCVLVAPCPTIALRATPREGFTWFANANEYAARYWTYEKPIQDAVSAVRKRYTIDPMRTFVAGEGEGGILAASIGIGSPGLFKGFVAIEAPLFEPVVAERAANAGKMGHAARYLWTQRPAFLEGVDVSREQYVGFVSGRLGTWGVEHTIEVLPTYPQRAANPPAEGAAELSAEELAKVQAERDENYAAVLEATLRSMMPVTEPATGKPAEAGSK